jgi:hypothetical protein
MILINQEITKAIGVSYEPLWLEDSTAIYFELDILWSYSMIIVTCCNFIICVAGLMAAACGLLIRKIKDLE